MRPFGFLAIMYAAPFYFPFIFLLFSFYFPALRFFVVRFPPKPNIAIDTAKQ
jgi:hypothetical protein